ncbi:MAG: GH92 family glycosyl hydrolase [Chitinophagaceae bacterium]
MTNVYHGAPMIKTRIINLFISAGVLFFTGFLKGVLAQEKKKTTAVSTIEGIDYIDPTIGNVAPLLNTNRPVVHLPNQMIRMFPKRQDHLDMQITDFPMLATNIITPQVIFGIKPSIGEVSDTGWYRRLTYDHDLEITKPWYYAVTLTDEDIRTEFTAGEKTGIYRFTFPAGARKNLLLSHYYANGQYELLNENTIAGTEFVNDAIHAQKGVAFMYGVFSGSPETDKKEGEKDWGRYTVTGRQQKPAPMKGERCWASYPENYASAVEFRYAISFISREQAKLNYERELKNTTFDQLKSKGKSAWEKVIGQVKVEGGTEAQKRTFYTALYRCYARMVDISEGGKYFSGYDSTIHEDKRPFYVDDYTWGNYLALHPLRAMLNPDREADMLQSYVNMYRQSGWMPEYPRHFGDRPGMFGFHSAVMFLDAYRKGVRNFDVNKAFEGMLKNAEKATMLPSRNGPAGDLETFYYAKGYYPGLHPGEAETDPVAVSKPGQKRSSVAVTLGNSYDSWALGELAKELGNQEIYKKYSPLAQNYKNLWYEKYNMFMPKDSKGNWIEIDPKFDGGHAGNDYFNENNGFSYKWNVQHDIGGLRGLMGGPDKLEQNLDQLFREGLERSKPEFWAKFPDQTSLIGQFGMGNQVTFFIPYLFNYTNAPWKTQKYTRLILDTWFQDNIFGVPGDEDGGAMSAFVVFSAMGFYPVSPGLPMYTITSPLFTKVTITLQNGKKFTLVANNASRKNKYIQSAALNGTALTSLFFSHIDLLNGGTLVLEMGEKTGKKWDIR